MVQVGSRSIRHPQKVSKDLSLSGANVHMAFLF